MVTILNFVFVVLHYLLQAVIWVLVANAIASWLLLFGVINMRNRTVNQIVQMLYAVTRPMLRPLAFIPPLGNVDIRPMILIILIIATDSVLLPGLFGWLLAMLAG
jgi:YggT family protein